MLKTIGLAIAALVVAGSASAQVHVQGYTRSDGTYVAPHTRSAPNNTTADNYGGYRAPAQPSYAPPSYAPSTSAPPACSGYSCYGQPSSTTGRARTERVDGYTRRDGTYVAPYYRSRPQ